MTFFIIASLIPITTKFQIVLMILHYRLRRNTDAYRFHCKKKLKLLCSL